MIIIRSRVKFPHEAINFIKAQSPILVSINRFQSLIDLFTTELLLGEKLIR